MPAEEKARLRDLVERAHAQGRRIRFWGAADRREMWAVQKSAGVDLINTDRLGALREFLAGGR
jgi:glycerophosphoryl diester phosphodiesterase